MGQAATKSPREELSAPSTAAAAAAVEPSPLPSAGSPGATTLDAGGDEMAAAGSASCRVSFRESIAKLKWTASSLESLKSAEERLFVSVDTCEMTRMWHR